MKNYLRDIDQKTLELIKLIGEQADQEKIVAYLAGGVVRDLLLKKKNFDLDIVLKSSVKEFIQNLSHDLSGKYKYYPAFKTGTIILGNQQRIDFTTLRKESYKHPGAYPTVTNGTLKEDFYRRDFTINALGIYINKNNFGKIIDYYDGLMDLRQRRVRVLHDKSFLDDPTRILRAIRFEQRLKFRIERKTMRLLKEAVEGGSLKNISSTRYLKDLRKNLEENNSKVYIKRLKQLGVLKEERLILN